MRKSRLIARLAVVLMATVCVPAVPGAQPMPSQGLAEGGQPSSAKPGILNEIGIDQRIGEQLPLDLPFTDETGRAVRLGDYFGKRPVILALVYYECPMLCTQVLNGLVSALGVMNFEAGREFDVVAVSFNPKEGPGLASQKKAAYIERYGRPHTAGGWHFLTGSEDSIRRLTSAVGFRYTFDDQSKQFAHGAAIQVLTPKGVLARYFYGIEFSARDIRFGLIEASEERIGTRIDDVLLLCYHYDPSSGKYGLAILNIVRFAGVITLTALGASIVLTLRRDRRKGTAVSAATGHS